MNVILDTNAYSELLRGNKTVLEWLEKSETILMSVIVIAELLSGFKGGSKEKFNFEILNKFLTNPKIKIIDVTLQTANLFSELKNYLRIKGKPIPINDIWIAAHSYQYESILISYDKHFKEIPNISIWEI